jgi:hypothetical protein
MKANKSNSRKFNKGDVVFLKEGYYYIYQAWSLERGYPIAHRPMHVKPNTPCKFVKNSPEGPSYKIVETPSGEHLEVLTAMIN